jgi:pimeloyl-ACP methyl ester carboxylesterase
VVLPAPPGRLVDIGGRRLHAVDAGTGPTTVILEAGAGGWSSHWGEVPARLARLTRTIAYDRAGMGWSDPGPRPRAAENIVADLGRLLDALRIDGPVILVGHSLGGSFARLASHRLQRAIAGVVFVDSWHESIEEWETRTGNRLEAPAWLARLHLWAGRLGVMQLLARFGPVPQSPWPIADATWRQIYALSARPSQIHGADLEARAFAAGDRQIAAITQIAAPVRVLVANETASSADVPPGFPVADYNAAWRAAADKLARLSHDSTITVLPDTDHMVPFRRPDAIVSAIAGLLPAH